MNAAISPVLQLEDFSLTYANGNAAVRGVSLSIQPGECLALVGESGCGKSSIARAIAGFLPSDAQIAGRIRFGGHDLTALGEKDFQRLRGLKIGYVAQDPFEACDPLSTIADHLAEPFEAHGLPIDWPSLVDRLQGVGVPDAEARMGQYPHQWSGGMLQRATIIAASAHSPPLIIADEPTSALDAHHSDKTLDVLRANGQALLLISHDLDLVSRHADRVAVCYAGKIVETGDARAISRTPRHPYTQGLSLAQPRGARILPRPLAGSPPRLDQNIEGCAFAPRCDSAVMKCSRDEPELIDGIACFKSKAVASPPKAMAPRPAMASDAPAVVTARGLTKSYGMLCAIACEHLVVRRGEIVGLSGPSGCGKSTLLRLFATLEAPTGGTLDFGFPTRLIAKGQQRQHRALPGTIMPIFQEPARSLNPRWPVWRSVAEPVSRGRWLGSERRNKALAKEHLDTVGLGHIDIEARPGELSLGQCQRVAIARALAAQPALIVADEPTSALDTAASAMVVSLLDAAARRGTAIVMVSHDRKLLESVCDRVIPIAAGQVDAPLQPV